MKKDNPFPDIIGQESVRKQLEFFIKGYNTNGVVNSLMFTAPKGCGKTTLLRCIAEATSEPARAHAVDLVLIGQLLEFRLVRPRPPEVIIAHRVVGFKWYPSWVALSLGLGSWSFQLEPARLEDSAFRWY